MSVPFAMGAIEGIHGMIGVPATILNNTMIGVQQPQQTAVPDRVDFKELLNTAVKSISDSQTGVDDAVTKLGHGQRTLLALLALLAVNVHAVRPW